MSEKKAPRPKGDGAIWFDEKAGKYRGQLDLGLGPNGKRQRRKVTGTSPTDVAEKLHAVRLREGKGMDVSKRSPTVAEFVQQWKAAGCPGPRGRKQASTLAALHRRLDEHMVKHIGNVRFDELRAEHFEQWWRKETAPNRDKRGPLSHATILGFRGDSVQLLNEAMRRRVIDWNPAKVAHMPEAREGEPRTVLTRDERDLLYTALEGNRMEAFFVLLADQGLRPGEAEALAWEHIDWERGVVHIERGIKRGDGGRPLEIGAPKNRGSIRSLALTSRTLAALRRHQQVQREEQRRAGTLWSTDPRWEFLVFTSEIGSPLHPSNVRRSLQQACERAGVPVVTPYELRHTAATILCDAVEIERVADQLGHRDTRMVMSVYRHRPKVISTAADVEDRHHMGTTTDLAAARDAKKARSDAL